LCLIWERAQEAIVERHCSRPYIILNAAITLDGKIATKSRDSKISCKEDLLRLHRLRANVDAIVVGVGTVLADDSQLTVHRVRGRNPTRVILDSKARTPPTARALSRDGGRTLVAVTEGAPKDRVDALLSAGAEVVTAGSGDKVDLPSLMNKLRERGINRVLVEGGGNVNWSLLELGLVDEVCVAVAPVIVGGKDSVTLAEGEGVNRVSEGVRLLLQRIEQYGEDLVLTYKPTIQK